jgi:hypothetical protein
MPKKKEQPIGCMTSFVVVLKPWEVFTSTIDRNIQERMSMKVVPLDIEPKGWGDNANMVTPKICNEGYKRNIYEFIISKTWQCVQI